MDKRLNIRVSQREHVMLHELRLVGCGYSDSEVVRGLIRDAHTRRRGKIEQAKTLLGLTRGVRHGK